MNPSRPTPAHIRAPSQAQRGYLFGAVYPAILAGLKRNADAVNEPCVVVTVDALHVILVYELLEKAEAGVLDPELCAFAFEDLDRKGVSDYIEAVCAWAAQRGIEVPNPS